MAFEYLGIGAALWAVIAVLIVLCFVFFSAIVIGGVMLMLKIVSYAILLPLQLIGIKKADSGLRKVDSITNKYTRRFS